MTRTIDDDPEISSAALSRGMETEIAKMIAEFGNAGVTGVVAAAVLAALHR